MENLQDKVVGGIVNAKNQPKPMQTCIGDRPIIGATMGYMTWFGKAWNEPDVLAMMLYLLK